MNTVALCGTCGRPKLCGVHTYVTVKCVCELRLLQYYTCTCHVVVLVAGIIAMLSIEPVLVNLSNTLVIKPLQE